jgi:hypothetical protein
VTLGGPGCNEWGIENPRVGGSIPPLATIQISLLARLRARVSLAWVERRGPSQGAKAELRGADDVSSPTDERVTPQVAFIRWPVLPPVVDQPEVPDKFLEAWVLTERQELRKPDPRQKETRRLLG